MNRVEVKKESLPTRCEICHQTDLFNRTRNQCLRCIRINTPYIQPDQNRKVIEKIGYYLKRTIYLATKIIIGSFIAGISAKILFEISFNSPLTLTKQEFKQLLYTAWNFGLAGVFIGSYAGLQISLIFKIKKVEYNLIYGTVLGLLYGYFMGTRSGLPTPCFMQKNEADYIHLCILLFHMFICLIIGIIISVHFKR